MNTVVDQVAVTAMAEVLVCPPWCVAEPGHGTSSEEIRTSGGVSRHHRGPVIAAVPEPAFSQHPVTVRIEQYVDLDPAQGVLVEAPVVAVHGAGAAEPGLTVQEAHALAAAITAAAETLDDTLPVAGSPT